jgi:hypothetical protein
MVATPAMVAIPTTPHAGGTVLDYSARMTWALDTNTMLAQTATRESAIPATARYARMANNADPSALPRWKPDLPRW